MFDCLSCRLHFRIHLCSVCVLFLPFICVDFVPVQLSATPLSARRSAGSNKLARRLEVAMSSASLEGAKTISVTQLFAKLFLFLGTTRMDGF